MGFYVACCGSRCLRKCSSIVEKHQLSLANLVYRVRFYSLQTVSFRCVGCIRDLVEDSTEAFSLYAWFVIVTEAEA